MNQCEVCPSHVSESGPHEGAAGGELWGGPCPTQLTVEPESCPVAGEPWLLKHEQDTAWFFSPSEKKKPTVAS